jgi:hypothetical protein
LGPTAQWLAAARENGDRIVSVATFTTPTRAPAIYVRERLGTDHPAAKDDFWSVGDSATSVIATESGAVNVIRVDWASARPHNMTHYVLQGTEASYISARRHHEREDDLIWIAGCSPGSSPSGEAEWESLWDYAEQYEHPMWAEWGDLAREAGHGGGDFFVLKDFFDAVQQDVQPPIDVYDAVAWSSVFPLSADSVTQGGVPVDIPDFRRDTP